MKNFILLNYNIEVDKIYSDKYFFVNDEKIYIIRTNKKDKEIDYLAALSNELFLNGIKVNTFIINNEKKYFTKKDNINIVLLRVNEYENDFNINDIIRFQNINSDLENVNIIDKWSKTIDDLENELVDYNEEYQLIQNSIDYFIGMGENAISLLNNHKDKIVNDSIGHLINYKVFNKCILNNPFNFIKINKMYDIANYIKYKLLTNRVDYDEIDIIINNNSDIENIYLFSCMMFPNIYFDLVNNIIKENEAEETLNKIINIIKDHRILLINMQNSMKNVKDVKLITWLSD